MILVKVATSEKGKWLEITGHAEGSDEKENIRVCAAVSALMGALAVASEKGAIGGDSSGFARVLISSVPDSYLRFVLIGLWTIKENYSDMLEFDSSAEQLLEDLSNV